MPAAAWWFLGGAGVGGGTAWLASEGAKRFAWLALALVLLFIVLKVVGVL